MIDDCKDYTNVFIDQMNAAARARSRVPFVEPAKPVAVESTTAKQVIRIPIGNRTSFNKAILEGIYGLNMLGYSTAAISAMLSIKENRILDVLNNHKRLNFENAKKVAAATKRNLTQLIALLRQA